MKKLTIFLRILGIAFFSYRAFIAYEKIDLNALDPSLYSYMFFIWIILILLITIEWIAEFSRNKKIIDSREQQFKDIQRYL